MKITIENKKKTFSFDLQTHNEAFTIYSLMRHLIKHVEMDEAHSSEFGWEVVKTLKAFAEEALAEFPEDGDYEHVDEYREPEPLYK